MKGKLRDLKGKWGVVFLPVAYFVSVLGGGRSEFYLASLRKIKPLASDGRASRAGVLSLIQLGYFLSA
jgi:hypothetical protein